MNKKIILYLAFLLLFCDCSVKNLGNFKDLEIPQNAEILPKIENFSDFNATLAKQKFFKVWHNEKLLKAPKDAFWALNFTKSQKYYDKNAKLHSLEFLQNLKFNANVENFGEISLPAITIKNAILRELPTDLEFYLNPKKPGEGAPFDYLLNSALGVGYPLFVSHFSTDLNWAFVQNDAVWGWIKRSEIKILDLKQIEIYESQKFLTILKDNSPLIDNNNTEILKAKIGTILPILRVDDENFYGYFIDENSTTNFKISKNNAAKFPLKFNSKNIKKMTSTLLGESYGWGGFMGLRDCSLLSKNFLFAFGFSLPRNSKSQAQMGEIYNLDNLTNAQKIAIIKEFGEPFKTLLYLKGHIMIYAGIYKGEVIVLHDIWGLRTKDNARAVIGKIALTTLEIGKNRDDIDSQNLLISRIKSMNILR